jgi:hypothetical protein
MRGIRAGLVLLVLIAAGFFMGRELSRPDSTGGADAAFPVAPAANSDRPLVQSFSGALDQASVLALNVGDSAVVVAVAAKDCLTCEDLDRQIRELSATMNGRMPLLIATSSSDSARVAEFVREARIIDTRVTIAPQQMLVDSVTISTPAAFVIGHDGRIRRGVSHLQRVPNVRVSSFAQSLGFIPVGLVPLRRAGPQTKGDIP